MLCGGIPTASARRKRQNWLCRTIC
uniref:Uncharacterized protein n=1 Tax=Arundo donax TaxID=35708 RepID=A0A0A8Z348_ARUDO